MALKSLENYKKNPLKSPCLSISGNSGNVSQCHLVKINFGAEGSITSKRSKIKNSIHPQSPYLTGNKVQMMSRLTEKRLVHRKAANFLSSFPLAANIYKANSDEFKLLKKGKKARKSVLTIPNEPASMTQACTVSDMNESEYYNRENDVRKPKPKKRLPTKNRRKTPRKKDYGFYDRDVKYCSELNINMDCSSTDMIKHFNGDGKRYNKRKYVPDEEFQPHDVWAVLRNMNRFQFQASPPMSEYSITIPMNKKSPKRRNNRKDARYVETCHTEEIAYISSYDVTNKSSRSFSQTSSFDRVTVIDKQDDFNKICEKFEKKMVNTRNLVKDATPRNRNPNKTKNKRLLKNRNINLLQSKENIPLAIRTKTYSEFKPPETVTINFTENQQIISRNSDFENNRCTGLNSSYPETNNEQNQTNFIYSHDSDGSSAAGGNHVPEVSVLKNEQVNVQPLSSDDSAQQLKGITKIILNKGQDIALTLQMEKPRRRLCLATTMPSASINPKYTQVDIKRKLACLKYPIVILGKDQLSNSPIHLINKDAPQFDGLDKQIWPYMVEWYRDDIDKRREGKLKYGSKFIESNNQRVKSNAIPTECKMGKVNNEISHNKPSFIIKEIKPLHPDSLTNKKKVDQKCPQTEIKKPYRQFKDKMLKFLYKKQSSQTLVSHQQIGVQADVLEFNTSIKNKVDVCTDNNKNKSISMTGDESNKVVIKTTITPNRNSLVVNRYPWAKAKWASDFIDTVIKKIRNGVYYNSENKSQQPKINSANFKEISIQAELTTNNNYAPYDEATSTDNPERNINDVYDPFKTLGFDTILPALEIETFDTNKIAIKHCTTNITVQFDVIVANDFDKVILERSSSLLRIDGTNGLVKLFKCKTTILNAMLPAELCSIIPAMIRNMNSIETDFILPHNLFTIAELNRSESPTPLEVFSVPNISISPALRQFIDGKFTKLPIKLENITTKAKALQNNVGFSMKELLPNLENKLPLHLITTPKVSLIVKKSSIKALYCTIPNATPDFELPIISCKALVPYTPPKHNLLPTKRRFEFNMSNIMRNYCKYRASLNFNSCVHFLKCNFNGTDENIGLNLNVTDGNGVEKSIEITINNFKIDSIFKNTSHPFKEDRIGPCATKSIQCLGKLTNKVESKDCRNEISVNNRMKRRKFKKLYRKCKSATNIAAERCSTPLSKIVTIDDFFQVISSKKSLASVFDDYGAKKILASIIEMKTWIAEINARQALLILILTNKKDTPNLVRFRPVLLQGIAVNRITRATELEMEIEVIERENMNKLPQYEGISYLPASVENQDNLLEELYWIAKTTASDYQRPFDESSEKLLKSLLEKRKKLNPSYLRVMARYVGLGLVKTPVKH